MAKAFNCFKPRNLTSGLFTINFDAAAVHEEGSQ